MGEPAFLERFAAWLRPLPTAEDSDRALFFRDGLIILDTNVLLGLYEYTEASREEVLTALETVSERLWMPYQVGLELVRGRRRTVEARQRALGDAAKAVNHKLNEARNAIIAAKNIVCAQLERYTRAPEEITGLDTLAEEIAVTEHLSVYREAFTRRLGMLRKGHDLGSDSLDAEDPIIPRIAALYGARVGSEPHPELLKERIEEATAFRYPNKIPPGFADSGKDTPLDSAGDFLLWEELIEHVRSLPEQRRVLFVSNDTKDDWYEPLPGSGSGRPWPSLTEELNRRAGAELRIENPPSFYRGIEEFLDASLDTDTLDEIKRVATRTSSPAITTELALSAPPPRELALAAFHSVALKSPSARTAAEASTPERWLFQWWLIGVTAQLKRRIADKSEPEVRIAAATRDLQPPSPSWEPGTVLKPGQWPYRESSWIAPWFWKLLNELPQDRSVLLSLAAEQAEADRLNSD